jgi:YHS domain-containing protein
MFRAILELIVTIIVAMAARAILGSLMKGFANASRSGFSQPADQPKPPNQPKERVSTAGDLHKDPVCGTYVAESTRYKRGSGRETFYYCSEACKDKHAVTAR